jgi:hypothetical protein
MRFDDMLCCPSCAAMFRPVRDEEICPKCERAEAKRLEELKREVDDGQRVLDSRCDSGSCRCGDNHLVRPHN